ncbi:Dimethylaniline monooxygenase [N-oxide-forming] 5 [Toxocara canis]|uniref:Flavin-containing monooxygenase n=1 Tax=Toxocara canis TaxID=6265 RepID=A0A0B2W196_TOXCA|nr:Dimethylaniline monooxygenase [N-oxide-forming] 5 [Toxocara canis]
MRACVIGGGVSGLPAIKECRAAGIEVVAYERTPQIGGLWNYRPQMKEGGTIMKSTISNTSKEMMAYSDFPPSADYPNFMHNSMIMHYVNEYAEKFDLLRDIRFDANVKKLERVGDKWEVTTTDGTKEQFDFAMLCTGHHEFPRYPHIKGIDKFQGRVLHSRDYRDSQGFSDKNVFIIGFGNSAIDMAVELANVANSVTISTRRGSWIANRLWSGGLPYDVALYNRFYNCLFNMLPQTILNDYLERHYEFRLGHYKYGIRPHHHFLQQPLTISDAFPNLLCSGRIIVTEDVDHVDAGGVIVEGGNRFAADVIIYATGYDVKFPYLNPQTIIEVQDNEVDLYKSVFPPDHPSLAVIGLVEPIGTIAPIAEMQSRWAAAIFSGRRRLPTKEQMLDDVERTRTLRTQRQQFYQLFINCLAPISRNNAVDQA